MTEPYGASSGIPVCPRHPDRQAFVRCQRCEQPVCPECQRPAAVGVQCVDCVAQAQARRPAARTQFGAEVRADQKPVVTWVVIGLCLAVYGLQMASRYIAGFTLDITTMFSYAPVLTSDYPLYNLEWWRMLTSSVLHSPFNAMHIAFNMMALWFVGRVIEPAIGRGLYSVLLMLSAFGGSVGVLYFTDPWTPTVGASGAVFGLFGALFILMRSTGSQTGGILALIVINMVVSFTFPEISWQGHLGGLIIGALCALVIAKAPRSKEGTPDQRNATRVRWQWSGLVAVAVLLIALTAIGIPLVDWAG